MLSVASTGGMRSLYERYGEVARRDPRAFPVGYLASDGATGAVAPFLWFRDEAELLRFVGTTELGLLRLAPLAHVEVLDALGAVARRERDPDHLAMALTVAFRGWTEFLWTGSFSALCGGDGEIPSELRAEFRAARHGAASGAPLAPDEIADLVGFLGTIAGSYGQPPDAGALPPSRRPVPIR